MSMILALAAGSLEPRSLDTQARYEIEPGTPVRLTVPGAIRFNGLQRIEGRLVRLDADSVVVADERGDHALALDRMLRIEWANPGDDPGGSALFAATIFGAFGGGIGGAIGAAWPRERWDEIPIADAGRREAESGP